MPWGNNTGQLYSFNNMTGFVVVRYAEIYYVQRKGLPEENHKK